MGQDHGKLRVTNIKIVVTIILILDIINLVTNLWVVRKWTGLTLNVQVIWGFFLALRHHKVVLLYTE